MHLPNLTNFKLQVKANSGLKLTKRAVVLLYQNFIKPLAPLVNSQEFFLKMKRIHQVEPKRKILVCRIRSSGVIK